MIFNIRCAFWWRADTEFDGRETMPLVKCAGRMVFLMGMKFKATREDILCELDETRAPTLTPFDRIHIHPIDVRSGHCKVGNDLMVESTYPNVTPRSNDFPKHLAGDFERKRLPRRKECVSRLARTVPYPDDRGFVVFVELANTPAAAIHGRALDAPRRPRHSCPDNETYQSWRVRRAGGCMRLLAKQSIVVGMAANPEPDESVCRFDGEGAVVGANASRPEPADLLEVKRRMPGVLLQPCVGLIGEFANLGR